MAIEIFKQGLEIFADQWQAPGTIDFYASGDLDDYISFSVSNDRPLITGVGNYLVLGKDATSTSGHSLDADDIIVGDDLEVDGTIFADSSILQGATGTGRLTQLFDGAKAIQSYTTCASTDGGTNWEPQRFDNVATGQGQVGCRFKVNLSTDVRLGGWANAFKAQVDCNDGGGAGGLLAVGCFEMAIPTAGVGALSCVELEMTTPATGYTGDQTIFPSYIFANCTGDRVAKFQDEGVFVHFDIGNVAATGNLIGAGYSTIRLAFGSAAAWTNYYIPLSTVEGTFTTSRTLTSQTGEDKHFDLVYSTDSTHTSDNIMYSGSTAATVLKITGTHTNTEGALYGLAVFLTASNNYTTDGDGAIAVRGLVTSDGSAITNGDIAGAFFCGKKTGANDAATSFILYGIEAFAYISGSGQTRTAIGANVGYHADTTANCSAHGSVWRGLQVFCDNVASDANNAEETTGLYIWPHSGTIKNALCIGTGTGTWTTGIKFVGGGTTTTGIKFGGYASDTGNTNVTMTTGIDMDECASMVTGISVTATCSTAAIVVGADGSVAGDVIFYGATSGQKFLWDASQQRLAITHSELVNDGGGAYNAAVKITAINNVALTSNRLCGLSVNVEPKSATDALKVIGAEICVYAGDASLSGNMYGAYIESQGFTGGVAADWYGLYVYTNCGDATIGGQSAVVRLEDAADTASTLDSFIMLAHNTAKGPANFMQVISGNFAGGNKVGTVSVQSGYLKIDWAGFTRYIPLYTTMA